ncbi:CDP-alcohol phosphatidyltransferase family protein [Knoellia sp. CPCC 206435]|uniref:CDP-alcohol phosphatidyltransferase family protein n=1 Tax=Knoellia terrae TaxID=3404797 RepID=UPI003B42EEAB
MADDDAHVQWSQRHGGLDARSSGWVAGWVTLTDRVARPLARREVRAHTVTALGVLVTATVPSLAAVGAAWPLAAVPVVVAAAVLDGVDGALASRTGTTSRWGQVLDGMADRVSDLFLVATLVVLGAPWELAAVLGALVLLLESVRASAQAAGMTGPGSVTVAERPARVLVTAFALLFCGLEWWARRVGVDLWPAVDGAVVATGLTTVGTVLGVVGLAQLLVSVRVQLRDATSGAPSVRPDRRGRPRSGPTG